MLKGIFALVVFALIAVSIIVMLVIRFTYKGVKKMRQDAEDNYYRQQKEKEQKEKNPFDKDYFKSADTSKKNAQRQSRSYAQPKQSASANQTTTGSKEETARKTSTSASSGVTIIDDRDAEDKRKIFEHSEGEYVEFEEV